MAWPEKEKTNRIFCVIFNHRWPLDDVACVAIVSSRGSSRKLGQEQKKKMNCFRSNFRAITRLETLATQAIDDGKRWKRLRYIQVTPSGWRRNMSAGTIFKDKQLKL